MNEIEIVPETFVSFAGKEGFRGAVVVDEQDPERALAAITAAGINPGGQAMIVPVYPGIYPLLRLLSKAELRQIDGGGRSLREIDDDERQAIDEVAVIVCEGCNS